MKTINDIKDFLVSCLAKVLVAPLKFLCGGFRRKKAKPDSPVIATTSVSSSYILPHSYAISASWASTGSYVCSPSGGWSATGNQSSGPSSAPSAEFNAELRKSRMTVHIGVD
jgi:hypothetical protein